MRTRNNPIVFFLNDEELSKLNSLAYDTELNRSEILRYLIKGCVLKAAPPAEYYMLIKQLRAIGNNLNQTLAIANANGILNVPDLKTEIAELRNIEAEIKKQFEVESCD